MKNKNINIHQNTFTVNKERLKGAVLSKMADRCATVFPRSMYGYVRGEDITFDEDVSERFADVIEAAAYAAESRMADCTETSDTYWEAIEAGLDDTVQESSGFHHVTAEIDENKGGIHLYFGGNERKKILDIVNSRGTNSFRVHDLLFVVTHLEIVQEALQNAIDIDEWEECKIL